MKAVFEGLGTSQQAIEYLEKSVQEQRVSQAYLFVGPEDSDKVQAAVAFAAAIVCENGGCGTCDDCRRALDGVHPDVRVFAPEGATGYLIEQVRGIVSDVVLAPVRAQRKVYIVGDIDRMGASPANAFLKTLEEPPADTIIICLARTESAVLSTIVSRCQVVRFSAMPPQDAVAQLVADTGAEPALARAVWEACGGSLAQACACLQEPAWLALRTQVLDALEQLSRASSWDILCLSRDLTDATKVYADAHSADQDAIDEESAEFLSASAQKVLATQNKRAAAAQKLETHAQLARVVELWLRDVLACKSGTPDLIVNADARAAIERAAQCADETQIVRSIAAARSFGNMFAYNVSPRICFDSIFLETKRIMYS